MPKFSKPFLVTIIASALILVWYFLSPQDTTTTHHAAHTTKIASNTDGFTAADLDAHFVRYAGGSRDPFIPGVLNVTGNGQSGSLAEGKSGWALTGINSVDGDQTACVENTATNESVFLKKGQTWNGLKVVAVAESGVLFENQLGQQTTLGFKDPEPDKGTPGVAAGIDPNAPSVAGIEPLPPMPLYGNQRPYAVLRRRNRRRDYTEGQYDQ